MEWIDRKKQGPPRDESVLVYWPHSGESAVLYRPSDRPDQPRTWSHWMPIPAPPPRKITIEIDEALARECETNARSWSTGTCWRLIGDACAAALEKSR